MTLLKFQSDSYEEGSVVAIRLVDGSNLLSRVSKVTDTHLHLESPMGLDVIHTNQGPTLVSRPVAFLPSITVESEDLVIRLDHVLFRYPAVSDDSEKQYLQSISKIQLVR